MKVNVGIHKLHKNAITPFKGTSMSACFDLCACLHNDTIVAGGRNGGLPVERSGEVNAYVQIQPDEVVLIPTGLIFILPETHHLKIYPRSGNTLHRKMKVANSPAVIDSDYPKETFVMIHNTSDKIMIVSQGDAIAQGEIVENQDVRFVERTYEEYKQFKKDLKKKSERRDGFGSTDKKNKK